MKIKFLMPELLCLSLVAVSLLPTTGDVLAQGTIYGEVLNSDLSVPPDGSIQFVGFIHNVDKEIRIQSCIGAAYESGHWYDDFQNYLSESPGAPYQYYFFDVSNMEGAVLSKTIPNNSFQLENIALSPATFPLPVSNLQVNRLDRTTVRLDWTSEPDVTWHVYRRDGSSEGSFFRVDNTLGTLTDRGETQPFYVDRTVDSNSCYYYVVVTESTPGNYSPASRVMFIDLTSCCVGQVGDINGIDGDEPTIGDVALLIDHLFISYTDPACMPEADVNQSGGLHPTRNEISIGDAAILIDHLFINFVPLLKCSDAAP